MGKYLGSVLCIHHRDTAPSMAIYEDDWSKAGDTLYQYYCFGCKASGYLDEGEADTLLSTTVKIKDKTKAVDTSVFRDGFSPQAKEFLALRNIESTWYIDYGIRETQHGLLYLPCYDYTRVEIGCQFRDIEGGTPKVWSGSGIGGKYPSYSVIYGYGSMNTEWTHYRKLVVVESILDGLSLWSRLGFMSVALLGTNPSGEFFSFVSTHVDKNHSRVHVVFDPDTPGQASARKLVDKLGVLGYNVINICLENVVYRVNKSVLEDVLI